MTTPLTPEQSAVPSAGRNLNVSIHKADILNSLDPAKQRMSLAWISASLGGYALAGGLLTLLGWALDIRRFTDWNNSGISQMPNNALAVVFAGAALMLLSLGQRRGGRGADRRGDAVSVFHRHRSGH